MKQLSHDITDRYFNLDNTFLKTFLHLFTQPEIVIEGYINGIRRKYLNPISYLGIALTLSGFIVFLIKKSPESLNFDIFNTGVQSVAQDKMFEFTFDYQAILFILYIPMMAIASWLCFEEKKYNLSERIIVFMYVLAHFSVFVFLPSIVLLIIYPQFYSLSSFAFLLFMFGYSGYVIKRISKEKGLVFIAKSILFYILFGIMLIGLSSLIPIFLFITGEVSLQDFAPIKK
ncbi:MAG: DUF3667 domain-containing protein [Bacteroidota bacterium]